jgi:hypothetical protein
MNHSYKTCLLPFFPSFHSAVASAAKTSFQRSPPTCLRMPFTKRSSYLIQIRGTLRPPCRSQLTHCFCDFLRRYLFQLRAPSVPLSSNCLDFRIAGVSSKRLRRSNRRAVFVAKILVQVSRKKLPQGRELRCSLRGAPFFSVACHRVTG